MPTAVGQVALAARDVSKSYPGVRANSEVSFEVRQGEVHALLGENGAGKTTLAQILSGSQRPDAGYLEVHGGRVQFRSPKDALSAGVGLVAQHFEVVPALSVAENILLADPSQPWIWDRRRAHRSVVEIGNRFGFSIDPSAKVRDISLGERQELEIVRVLYRGAAVVILDEPTSVLTPQQADKLFESLREMTKQGKSIVLISHKLDEVLSLADRITVMRDGRVIETLDRSDTDANRLAFLMVGREIDLSRQARPTNPGLTLLDAKGIYAVSQDGRTTLSDVNLHVREAEIVGIAGVSGNGQELLADCLSGISKLNQGSVQICEQVTTNLGPVRARGAGLRYVPGDRLGTGLAPGLTIADNLILTREKPLFFGKSQVLSEAGELLKRFDVRAGGADVLVRTLSGGNAQKVLLGRELGDHSRVSVVVSPTWGLDVGAVEFVRGVLAERRANSGAILLISEDLDELCALADRIYVIHDGRIEAEFQGPSYDIPAIGLAMAGATPGVSTSSDGGEE